jgi:hypothetical protein
MIFSPKALLPTEAAFFWFFRHASHYFSLLQQQEFPMSGKRAKEFWHERLTDLKEHLEQQ